MNQMQMNSTAHSNSSSMIEGFLAGRGGPRPGSSSNLAGLGGVVGGGGGGGSRGLPPNHLQQHITSMHHQFQQQPLQMPFGSAGTASASASGGGGGGFSGGHSHGQGNGSSSNFHSHDSMVGNGNGGLLEGGGMNYGGPGLGLELGTGLGPGLEPGLGPGLVHPNGSIMNVGVGVGGTNIGGLPQGCLPPLHPSSYLWQQQQQQQQQLHHQQLQQQGHPLSSSSSSSSSSSFLPHPHSSSMVGGSGDNNSNSLSLKHIPPSVQREYQMLYPDTGLNVPTPLARSSSPSPPVFWGQEGKGTSWTGKKRHPLSDSLST